MSTDYLADIERFEFELKKTKDELDRIQNHAAEMQKALIEIRGHPDAAGTSLIAIVDEALSGDACVDYVRKKDVKPLVEALEKAREELFTQVPRKTWCQTLAAINSALAHAKEKGWL